MVDAARAKALALVDALLPFADAGIAIIGLEPSCLLTLRDEALALRLGEKANRVAAHALLFEEFVARETKGGRFAVDFDGIDAPVLVHGHCHQKAFAAVAPILDVLRLVPGANPILIETSCCGMAGSFGYEVRHQDASRAMAEASLLPAIRAVPDAIVVADGTSCRQQIAHGAQREALHSARFLERFLPGVAR
jgi:Fe-S oxidoreductase